MVIETLPYIDPLLFKEQKESKEQTNSEQHYKANKKSDVYSVGVLLWEVSSGRLPFESYYSDAFITELQNGKRESPIPGMPDKYVDIYTSKDIIKLLIFIFVNFIKIQTFLII
jgi:serine/threonine protein kinase